MANKLKESAKNILGLNSSGPLLQRTDYENLISLSDATKEDHELAMKNNKG
ncbi:MAG: hypothetical protein H6772_02825 [Pseudomonadales bacterium]|nr:hypothetical protein [Pseudomonadales bacterium]